MCIRSGYRVHGVEADAKLGGRQQLGNQVEVEHRLDKLLIVGDGIYDLNFHVAELIVTEGIEIDIRRGENLVLAHFLAASKNRFGNVFRCGSAGVYVVLDSKVAIGSTR